MEGVCLDGRDDATRERYLFRSSVRSQLSTSRPTSVLGTTNPLLWTGNCALLLACLLAVVSDLLLMRSLGGLSGTPIGRRA